MTIDDLKALKREYITPDEVSAVTGWSTSKIRGYARKGELGFPVIAPDRKNAPVKISRIGFINYWEGKKQESGHNEIMTEIKTELHQITIALMSMNVMLMAMLKTLRPDLSDMDETIEGVMKQ